MIPARQSRNQMEAGFNHKEHTECCAQPVQAVQAVQAEMGSLDNLNVLDDSNVWYIPELKACLRGETVFSCQFADLESQYHKIGASCATLTNINRSQSRGAINFF
jgi:hypothetical protein